MSNKGKKLEPKLGLNMDFDEAMSRFAATLPSEVEASIAKSKEKKPPDAKKKRKSPGGKKVPSGVVVKDQSVISLRDRRMAKRNYGR